MQAETSLRASNWPPSLPFAFDPGRPSPSSLSERRSRSLEELEVEDILSNYLG
jgi:hypothetical protein